MFYLFISDIFSSNRLEIMPQMTKLEISSVYAVQEPDGGAWLGHDSSH